MQASQIFFEKRDNMKKYLAALLVLIIVLTFTACFDSDQGNNETAGASDAPTAQQCAHQFGKWSVTREATCKLEGIQSRECELCGFFETGSLTQLPHVEEIDEAVAATCTTDGMTEGKHCSVCDTVIVKQNVIPAAHNFDAGIITKEPSCYEEGVKTLTCVECGVTNEKSIAKIAHGYDSGRISTQATCNSNGIKTYTCLTCDKSKTETIPKLGHLPNKDYVCSRCGEKCPVELSMTTTEKNNASAVHYISQRQIWHQDDEGRYVLVFSLLDKNEKELSAPAVVEIKIQNDKGEVVYTAIRTVKSSDFTTWYYNNGSVKKYQATIYIYDNELSEGLVDDGDIYFTVYNSGYFSFSESTLSVSGLPVKPTTIILPTLPTTIHDYNYNGKIDSSVKITSITYEISGDDAHIYFTGEKIYDADGSGYSQSCKVGWKLYDEDGYTVASGTFYSTSIAVGEKFRNEKVNAWNVIEPGKTYTLVIMNVD